MSSKVNVGPKWIECVRRLRRGESAMGTIGIVEGNGGGHRFVYVGLLARRAMAQGDDVVLLVSDRARRSEGFRVHVDQEAVNCGVIVYEEASGISGVLGLAKRSGVTRLVIPEADGWLSSLLTCRMGVEDPKITALIMRDPRLEELGASPRRAVRRMAKWATIRALTTGIKPNLRLLFLCDPLPELWIRGRTVPDPVAPTPGDGEVARFRKNLPDSEFWFGLVGAISARKSPLLIAQSALKSGLTGCGLAIVGPQTLDDASSVALRTLLCELSKSGWATYVLDRTLTDAEVSSAIATFDCVVVAYTNPHPPSTLSKASALATRTIVAGPPETLRSAARLGASVLTPELSTTAVAAAMCRAKSLPTPRPKRLLGWDDFAEAVLNP